MDYSKKNKFTLPHQYLWKACGRVSNYLSGGPRFKSPEKIRKSQLICYRKCLRDMKYLEETVWLDQKIKDEKSKKM